MEAIVIGATGATGKDLVHVLLQDNAYVAVKIFVRRPCGIIHTKLQEIITDFDNLEAVAPQIKGDVLFICFGTTLKAAGSKDKQRHIDLEIPLTFASIARRNAVQAVVLLSAYGAAVTSKVFYSALKGKLEDGISALAFNQCIIFRPGLLLRNNTDRLGERMIGKLLQGVNAVGLFRKFRPMPTITLAQKMAKGPTLLGAGKHVIELADIFKF